jgi:hypothetical protein
LNGLDLLYDLVVFRKERWMNANPNRSYRFIKKIKFTVVFLCLLIASLAFTCMGIGWEEKNPLPDNQAPVQSGDQPAQPANQNDASAAEVIGGWYGPACDEPEGTFIYRWSVDLMKDPDSKQIVGTVKFHDCPGGGRVLYHVVGDSQTGSVISLTAKKMEGGGALFSNAADSTIFTFDSSSGKITPRPVSSWGYPGLPMKPVGFINTGTIAYTVQVQTYIPQSETNPATPSDASTVAMPGERNSSSYLSLPLGTYTWCYWWGVGDINNDGYLDYRHAYDLHPFVLDENAPDELETARTVTLSAPPSSGELSGTCNQP